MSFNVAEFGNRLREMRGLAKMTQKELAKKVNVEVKHISRMEKGKRACSIDSLIELKNALHTSADFLLTGEEQNNDKMKQELLQVIDQLYEIVQRM